VAESGAAGISRPRTRRPFRRGEEGASLVEFALVLPLFALLLFGMIDFGIIFGGYMQMRSGVQAATRSASLGENTTAPGTCIGGPDPNTANLVCIAANDIGSLQGVAANSTEIGITLAGGGAVNTDVTICAKAQLHSTTGLTAPAVNGKTVTSSSTILIEQPLSAQDFNSGSVTFNGVKYNGTTC
jgi:Flp pilus assembly protein TadG